MPISFAELDKHAADLLAENIRLRDLLAQVVDDFGDGHCVCEETKQMCIKELKQ